MKDHMKFSSIRNKAFIYWKTNTGRSGKGYNESISNTYECDWQLKAEEKFSRHISIFCSLGEWASNVSDILKDKSLDDLDILNKHHRKALFRFYTRFILVFSEMLTDFQNIYQIAINENNQNKIREYLSPVDDKKEITLLFEYINRVFKHKTKNLHACNHHLDMWFEDASKHKKIVRPIRIGEIDFSDKSVIVVPQLEYLVGVLINCYIILNELFDRSEDAFENICKKYE